MYIYFARMCTENTHFRMLYLRLLANLRSATKAFIMLLVSGNLYYNLYLLLNSPGSSGWRFYLFSQQVHNILLQKDLVIVNSLGKPHDAQCFENVFFVKSSVFKTTDKYFFDKYLITLNYLIYFPFYEVFYFCTYY